MTRINPVSDLRNYNTVLEKVSAGTPVYLTVNGRGRYTIRDIADDEEFERTKAMLRIVYKAYMAFYRVEGEQVKVDRVVFGRSDYMRSVFK